MKLLQTLRRVLQNILRCRLTGNPRMMQHIMSCHPLLRIGFHQLANQIDCGWRKVLGQWTILQRRSTLFLNTPCNLLIRCITIQIKGMSSNQHHVYNDPDGPHIRRGVERDNFIIKCLGRTVGCGRP